jgi:transposase InsO family protein
MDYLTLEPSKGEIQNILVIADHFTKFAVAVPTGNQTAKTTAEALLNHFITPYGLPRKLHSDQGANFSSKLIQELCQTTGIMESRTTPYHPMGNDVTGRFIRTLISMMGTLEPEKKSNWKSYIGPLVHA